MKLFELFESDNDFERDDPLRVATTAVLSQIKADIEDSAYEGKFTVKALLGKLANNGINISQDQLLELVTQEPWSNLIANVKDDQVMFKDESSEMDDEMGDEEDPVDTAGTIDKMAKRASKKQEM